MNWRRAAGLLTALTLALTLTACARGRATCPPGPAFEPTVDGQPLANGQGSGNGQYCGAIGDGVAADFLDPVRAKPSAQVVLTYSTKARWNTVTYAIYAGEAKVQGGRLNANRPAFKLPDKPGTFIVTIRGENRYGHSNTYFKILIAE